MYHIGDKKKTGCTSILTMELDRREGESFKQHQRRECDTPRREGESVKQHQRRQRRTPRTPRQRSKLRQFRQFRQNMNVCCSFAQPFYYHHVCCSMQFAYQQRTAISTKYNLCCHKAGAHRSWSTSQRNTATCTLYDWL